MLSIVLAAAFAPQPHRPPTGGAAVFAGAEGAGANLRARRTLTSATRRSPPPDRQRPRRWTAHTQWWEGIGVSVNLEAILNDPSKMAELKPMSEAVRTKSGNLRRALSPEEKAARSPARTPARRAFCNRNNLVQRWVHSENVGLLPFTDEAMAASVGATAASSTPSRSTSSRRRSSSTRCRRRRAASARSTTATRGAPRTRRRDRRLRRRRLRGGAPPREAQHLRCVRGVPGALNLVMLGVAIKLDAYHLGLDALQEEGEPPRAVGAHRRLLPRVPRRDRRRPLVAEAGGDGVPAGDPWERGIPKVAPKAEAAADDDLAAKLEGALPLKVEPIEAKDGAASQ